MCIILWEILVTFQIIPGQFLPAPTDLIDRMFRMMQPAPIMQNHIFHSLYRFIIGYIIAILAGLIFGILIGVSTTMYRMFNPFISLFVSLPTIAWVPLLLVLVGLGDTTIIFAIFLGAFFPMVYNTTTGIQSVDRSLIQASRIMGAGTLGTFAHVVLPGSMVSVLTGLKLGIGNAWRALVGAEMLAASLWGIGYLIYTSRAFYDVEAMFIGLVLIGILSLFFDLILIRVIENLTVKKWGMVRD